MHIVVAPDSYKGSVSAREAAEAMARGVRLALPDCKISKVPVADGGEGTLDCVLEASGGTAHTLMVSDPLGRSVPARLGILDGSGTCIIETAEACGLHRLTEPERNPLVTSTFGVGQLIMAGLDLGCRSFVLGLGGSSTNDGGAGMLQALGIRLLDKHGEELVPGGAALERLHQISTDLLDPRLAGTSFIAACDVDNPLIGPDGASAVFGPQKGASLEDVSLLDNCLAVWADHTEAATGIRLHSLPGAGAAGGMGGALIAYLRARMVPGFEVAAEMTGLEAHIRAADLVLTGEGRTDAQTIHGKAPCGVARLAQRYGVPAVVLSGAAGSDSKALHTAGVTAVFSITNEPMLLEAAIRRAPMLIEQAAEQVVRLFCAGQRTKQD
ncbi:glycerate kinase [Paenibacillus sambharensis]|uniref:Glycerate kinase n=1 Tax=Paenibacillus sambharensis TaxID=1803190 RepID=A0A2W1L995_9BACL|nr:glycerate kinase [Paenibacillus sambharensis]PZD95483.1 glycerate kinase [Paenibacillus sambharensis]